MEPTGSSCDTSFCRKVIRNRKLDEDNVFQHNAWDDVEWDEEQIQAASAAIQRNSAILVPSDQQEIYEEKAPGYWDDFYQVHSNRFFKDRNWLYSEFKEIYDLPLKEKESPISELTEALESSTGLGHSPSLIPTDDGGKLPCRKRILEVGCGVGNTVFPILETTRSEIYVFCCDFSPVAIKLVKEHPLYNPDICHAFVCDITNMSEADIPFEPCSLDVITMIFVLSAIRPDKMQSALTSLANYLRPGGMLLFRDYGRCDLAQLRFKPGQCLSDNFYVRGDGTRVYFFTQEEIHNLFVKAGLEKVQNLVDRRLQVNRGRQLKMYRVWIQAKYQKPLS